MRLKSLLLIFPILIIATGCSGGNGNIPTAADDTPPIAATHTATHQTWGTWQFIADPVKETLDVVQLRGIDMHVNVLPFLEPPPLTFLTLESLQFNGDIIEADIGLRHPFLGLNEFTGFDVCGILISNGSVTGFDDAALVMAGDGDTHLLNPDGWTRWWNPTEFPNDGTIKSYTDGLLGAPDAFADYNTTLNAYKYFCDDLDDPSDPLSEITIDGRGLFSPGQKNIRHYTIQLGTDGLVFNYAIDACWQYPQGAPPWTAPDDFTAAANRPEAYRIEVNETENTLWAEGAESGGDLSLLIGMYDWFNADLNTVQVESTGNFDTVLTTSPIDGGPGYSTYQVDITEAYPVTSGEIDLFITVQSDSTGYDGLLPGEPVCAYFFSTTTVDDEKPYEPPEDPGWTQGYFNNLNHNWNPSSTIELPLTQVWSSTLTQGCLRPPIVRGDQLWITASNGYLQSYDATDGSFLWENDIKTAGSFWAGCNPLIYGDKVISGGNGIFCFDAVTGAGPDWVFMQGSDFLHMGGVIVDDTAFWRSCHNQFYSVDLTDGSQNWSAPGSTFPLFNPGANEDYVLYPSGNSVICYTTGGTYNWNMDIGGNFYGGPLINEGKAYFGYTDLRCVDIATGSIEWTVPYAGGYSFSRSLVLCEDRIVSMTRTGSYPMRLYCADFDGNLLWTHDLDLCMTTGCYSNGYYFTVARDSGSPVYELLAIDVSDGTTVEAVPGHNISWSGVTCTNDRLYFANNSLGLYCYE
jgi:hypothetical protein